MDGLSLVLVLRVAGLAGLVARGLTNVLTLNAYIGYIGKMEANG